MSTRFVPSPTRRSRPERARAISRGIKMRDRRGPQMRCGRRAQVRKLVAVRRQHGLLGQRFCIANSTRDSPPSSRNRTAPIHRRRIDRCPRTRRSGCSCKPSRCTPCRAAAGKHMLRADVDSLHRTRRDPCRCPARPRRETRSRCPRHAAATAVAIANVAAHHLDALRLAASDTRRGRNCARDRRAPAALRRCSRPEIRRRR